MVRILAWMFAEIEVFRAFIEQNNSQWLRTAETYRVKEFGFLTRAKMHNVPCIFDNVIPTTWC